MNDDERIVKAAMAWYRKWNRECAEPPTVKSGHDLGEVQIFNACKRKAYHRTYCKPDATP